MSSPQAILPMTLSYVLLILSRSQRYGTWCLFLRTVTPFETTRTTKAPRSMSLVHSIAVWAAVWSPDDALLILSTGGYFLSISTWAVPHRSSVDGKLIEMLRDFVLQSGARRLDARYMTQYLSDCSDQFRPVVLFVQVFRSMVIFCLVHMYIQYYRLQ